MDHRVRIDGRFLVVSDKGLDSALRIYVNGHDVNYRALKDALLRFEVDDQLPDLGETGHLDFDYMETCEREEPVARGPYLFYVSEARRQEEIQCRQRDFIRDREHAVV